LSDFDLNWGLPVLHTDWEAQPPQVPGSDWHYYPDAATPPGWVGPPPVA
jgi:hypothetical protein